MIDDVETITRNDIKKTNRMRIYNVLREKGKLSRAEISRCLNLSQPTVGKNLQYLEKQGLIIPSEIRNDTGGRHSQIYEIDANHRAAISVSITKRHISAVVINLAGITIAQIRIRYPFARRDSYFQKLGSIVAELIDRCKLSAEQILGVAIVLPALITADGRRTYYNQVLNIENEVECEEFSTYIPFPTKFFHDTTSAAYAEKWFNPDLTDFIYMMISDSIGGAAIINGLPYVGTNNRSCEIAHMKLISNGKPCYCGGKGCMEPYCSTRVLSDITDGDLPAFFDLLENGDGHAVRIWKEYVEYLSYAIINARLLYDCSVVIGGYLGQYMERYLPEVRERMIQEDPFTDDASYLSVCKCKNEASATGAALDYIANYTRSL